MASTHVARISAGGVTNRRIAPSIYYTCSTAADTAAKTITTDSTNKWTSSDLFEGLTIYVKFTNSNSVASPTLNIDSIGAKPIYRYGTTAPSTSAASAWNAGSIIGLTYDTTLNSSGCWVMHDWNNTTYSALSQSDATAGTSTTSRLITAKVLSDTIDEKINGLPTPMQFIGTVGTDGTITWANLAAAAAANTGYTYKVITDHNAETGKPAAKAGDTIISNGSEWIVIPSGDEPSGTVTSITLKAGTGISLDTDNTAITSSGTRTISHADTSSQLSSSNSGRTYIQSVTLDDYGHVTGLSTATEDVTNTDTKLQVAAVTSGTTYYPIVGTGTTAATRQYDTTGLVYVGTNGTANGTNGNSLLTLGNSTASTTANWKKGTVRLYGTTTYYTDVVSGAPTANRTITLPNATGTVALTTDIPDVSSFITDAGVTKITTTAGTHTAITNSTGAVSFNVPTKRSNLTNDSGFITSYTDENMKWTASTSSNTYYPLQSTSTATTSTANTLNGISFYQYYNTAGGYRRLDLGNATAYKSTGGAYGTIRLYGAAATYYGDLVPGVLGTTSGDGHISANRTWTLPDKTGTIALISDIPTVPTNISSFTNDSGYVTTDTDEKVKQENSTASSTYRVLLSHGANDTTETSTTYKSTNLKFTPSTGNLQATQLNGVTIGSSPKFSDTVTTVTSSGSGNVVTGMTASNGAITYTMGTIDTTSAQIVRW